MAKVLGWKVRNLASLKWDGNCGKKQTNKQTNEKTSQTNKQTNPKPNKQLEIGLNEEETSAFLSWKLVHHLVSLRACTHLRNWELETQLDSVEIYAGEKIAASRVQDGAGRNVCPVIPVFKNVLLM